MRKSVPNLFSHFGPVQPSSQKHEPVPLGPSSHEPCSVQLQAKEERKETNYTHMHTYAHTYTYNCFEKVYLCNTVQNGHPHKVHRLHL